MFHRWHTKKITAIMWVQTICFGTSQFHNHLKEAQGHEENDQLVEALESTKNAVLKIDRLTEKADVLDAYKMLVRLSCDLERYNETISYANDLIGKDKTKESQFFGLRYLGHAFWGIKKRKKAIRHYQSALKLDAQDNRAKANIYFSLGGIFMESGDFKRARKASSIALNYCSQKRIQAI